MDGPGHRDGTVGKALDLLDEVASIGRPVRFAEILAQSRLPKATLHRLLRSLTNQGMLAYDADDHRYRPGLRLVRLAHSAWAQSSIASVARPVLDRLSCETDTTVHLAKLDGGQVLYLDKRIAARPLDMFSQAGKIGPAYCTGIGKAMLAFLDAAALDHVIRRQSFYGFMPNTITSAGALTAELAEVRRSGIAFDRSEHERDIICVAAPILTQAGRVLGALSITSSPLRHSLEDLATFAPRLRAAAAEITENVEAWQFPEPPRSGTPRPQTDKESRACPE